eukprot:328140-Lingulodinium_polyedra.AAC.1
MIEAIFERAERDPFALLVATPEFVQALPGLAARFAPPQQGYRKPLAKTRARAKALRAIHRAPVTRCLAWSTRLASLSSHAAATAVPTHDVLCEMEEVVAACLSIRSFLTQCLAVAVKSILCLR